MAIFKDTIICFIFSPFDQVEIIYYTNYMNKLIHTAYTKIAGLKVYALVGSSGTGKSHHSKIIAKKYNIELIIDDGLLIKNNKILAGKSAKKDANFLQAVKTAVFNSDEHRDQVLNAIEKQKLKKIMIIGTSEKMIDKIIFRLNLPPVFKLLLIEDVVPREEIDKALRIRYTEGKHVIPVPTMEITRSYPQIVYDSIKVMIKTGSFFKKDKVFEKTIVLPEFYRPAVERISDSVMTQKISQIIFNYDRVIKAKKVTATTQDNQSYELYILLKIPIKHYMSFTMSELKVHIKENLEAYNSIIINSIGLEIEN